MSVDSVILPKVGVYMEDILLAEWHREDGARVETGEVLLTFETDKVSNDLEAEASGWLHRTVDSGSMVPVGGTVGYIASTHDEYRELTAGETNPDASAGDPVFTDAATAFSSPEEFEAHPFLNYIQGGGPDTRGSDTPVARPPETRVVQQPGAREGALVSPRARAVIAAHGLSNADVARIVPASGRRLTDRDVLAFVESRSASEGDPTTLRVSRRIPLEGMRGTIARRMHESLMRSAQLTSVVELDASALVEWRKRATPKPSYTAAFVCLVARALRAHPLLNSRVDDDAIDVVEEINIGVAVDLDEGILVPVVHRADSLSLDDVDRSLARVVEQSRRGELPREALRDCTFTLSNSGTVDVDLTTAIINPPQAAILWLGRIKERPVVHNGELAVRWTVYACLTFDHRAIDGAPAARFLETLQKLLAEVPHSITSQKEFV